MLYVVTIDFYKGGVQIGGNEDNLSPSTQQAMPAVATATGQGPQLQMS